MVIIFHIQHTQIYHFHSFFFGVKKGVKVACGMKNVLTLKKTVKILRVHYSYNKKFENEKNFKNHIQKIETVLKIRRMRNLTLEGKITIFNTLVIFEIINLVSVTVLRNSTVTQQNKFIWNHKRIKIEEKTLINNFE